MVCMIGDPELHAFISFPVMVEKNGLKFQNQHSERLVYFCPFMCMGDYGILYDMPKEQESFY